MHSLKVMNSPTVASPQTYVCVATIHLLAITVTYITLLLHSELYANAIHDPLSRKGQKGI